MAAERTIEGGRSAVIFLELDFEMDKAPAKIGHVLHVTDDKGNAHDMLAPLPAESTAGARGRPSGRPSAFLPA